MCGALAKQERLFLSFERQHAAKIDGEGDWLRYAVRLPYDHQKGMIPGYWA
jgi:hypothetical protein